MTGEATRTRQRGDPRELRDLLVALNAHPDLHRDAICRLARSIDAWIRLDAGGDLRAAAKRCGVLPEHLRAALDLRRNAPRTARHERRRAADLGGRIVTPHDPGYPAALADLELPPPALYLRGELPAGPAVAIVGARQCDPYGLAAAERFARELAARGLTIVSGMALGADTAAHRGALAAAAGRTVAVLGCGLDIAYPRSNRRLAERIAERGALASELPPGTRPYPANFPVRNRIIAALTLGTLVARAKVRSGSLVTARLALELGREIWAVPGAVFDALSRGPNLLIRDGAALVERPRDVLESLPCKVLEQLEPPVAAASGTAPAPGGAAAAAVLARLEPGRPATPEALAAGCGLPIESVQAALVQLELADLARRFPGGAYTRGGGA